MNNMGDENYFDNDVKMFVPLTIDDLEMETQNYFFSGKKFMIAALSLLPYIAIFFFLDYVPNMKVFIIYTIAYLIGYTYIIRFAVFEESRQKNQMLELENNKYSDLAYFWQLDKVGSGKRDDGLMYIQSDGLTVRRAYMIEVDSGSTVGVPETAYRNYREVWQKFFRSCYNLGFEVKMYNVRKKPELTPSLREYGLQLQDIENEAYRSLMQLNIDTNLLYAISEEQRYITYIEVINRRVDNLVNFRTILADVIEKSFETDGLFSNPKILDKSGVDKMLSVYFGQDTINSTGIHRTDGYKPISDYADIVNIWDSDGNSIPFEILDFIEGEAQRKSKGSQTQTLESILEKESEEEKRWEKRVEDVKDRRIRNLQAQRRDEKISYEEYIKEMDKVESTLTPEKATEFDLLDESEQKKRKRQEEMERRKKERREQRLRDRQKQEEADETKWYEEEDSGASLEDFITETDYQAERKVDFGDLSLEDLIEDEDD